MKTFKYVIVGGGMAADAATKGLRELDAGGTLAIVTDEPHPPYDRPPLSKGLWKGKPIEKIWRKTLTRNVELIASRRVVSLDPGARQVMDDQGEIYRYEKLLLATGGTPRRIPAAGDVPIYFRTLNDYNALRALADQKQHFVVIGGGFIGSEVAAALAMNGRTVTMAFPEVNLCGRVFPEDLAGHVHRCYAQKGVRIRAGRSVSRVARDGDSVAVHLDDGTVLAADAVVAGLGILPNTALASQAGLKTDNGIVVNEALQTAHPDIFAAGDVASFACQALGVRTRVEHEDNANTMGKTAGRNMAGAQDAYRHLPYFYSDLFDDGYEAVGETDVAHRTVSVWQESFKKGAVFYLRDTRVRGVLLWNTFGKIDAARALIATAGPHTEKSLKAWTADVVGT